MLSDDQQVQPGPTQAPVGRGLGQAAGRSEEERGLSKMIDGRRRGRADSCRNIRTLCSEAKYSARAVSFRPELRSTAGGARLW